MTTILFAFFSALSLSLVLTTPTVRWAGNRFGVIDVPDERKMHAYPIPRVGGVAIFAAVVLTLSLVVLIPSDTARRLQGSLPMMGLILGAVICFLTGLVDDLRGLPARTKLLLQIIAASVAYAGGLQIQLITMDVHTLYPGLFNYAATVLWFLVFLNAVNLVDGLDGLASGITFFAALVMVVLSVLGGRYLSALLFATLAGSILGFLPYNFNPASIFLGDSGSYLLGFAMAGLAIFGGSKSQVGTAMLIPAIALGVPLFDTLLSTVRRFVVGKNIFGPDKEHIHHRLIALGLNTRRAVLLLYGITVILCLTAFLLVNFQDERAALVLGLLGVASLVFARKLGYFDYLQGEHLVSWLKDISDESGISHGRRSFLNAQIAISHAREVEHLWLAIGEALKLLEMDRGMLYIDNANLSLYRDKASPINYSASSFVSTGLRLRSQLPQYLWTCQSPRAPAEDSSHNQFRIELPLEGLGTLVLIKDLYMRPLSHYAIKHIEHLRRVVVRTMENIAKQAPNQGDEISVTDKWVADQAAVRLATAPCATGENRRKA
jgi:UDP-GlcNAc:undecaprenyl-phosphate GlcNAc-1-phosphate transferase